MIRRDEESQMMHVDFSKLNDQDLATAAFDESLGFSRAKAITELASRAVANPDLLDRACEAITSARRVGFHSGPPLGWFGADEIYLSGRADAMRALLRHMNDWDPTEQEDLVRHWAGRRGVAELSRELHVTFQWEPRYRSES